MLVSARLKCSSFYAFDALFARVGTFPFRERSHCVWELVTFLRSYKLMLSTILRSIIRIGTLT